jgi:IS5 family transposase
MRKIIVRQLPLVPALREHPHVRELEQISGILDDNPVIAALVHADLVRDVSAQTGSEGLSGDQVVRAAILYCSNQWSYSELAFELMYHAAYRAFCRLGIDEYPSKSALHRDIKRIEPETWEAIHEIVIGHAKRTGVEDGKRVRTDCTVMESTIHEPSDSSLLWDCVRVLARQLEAASDVVSVSYSDHRKRAKRRAWGINNAKSMTQRIPLYRDLLKVTRKTIGYAKRTMQALKLRKHPLAAPYTESICETIELANQVVDQTERRIFDGESVPATEKVVSIFEPHTDVIRKGGRETLYGHKLCLSSGPSNLITECLVLDGNPPDSSLAVEMMKRHEERFGCPAQQVALDGGFASKQNLVALKAMSIRDVAFSKRVGLAISDMVQDSWVYKRLRDFRAGIEGVISFLKRAFGMGRCRWKGLRSFKSYALSSVVVPSSGMNDRQPTHPGETLPPLSVPHLAAATGNGGGWRNRMGVWRAPSRAGFPSVTVPQPAEQLLNVVRSEDYRGAQTVSRSGRGLSEHANTPIRLRQAPPPDVHSSKGAVVGRELVTASG